ncbi:hypothetical protein NDU88_006477 [Pleurodeles waltl]|uniref:Uncharacterized protein n=1 Tax=Pleurodeles waltl TaxID=8319 RepID=A0AAV7LP83_PLEWA|nr:hypothetical protein NDU88_006477 [Pleurodeles waltl]
MSACHGLGERWRRALSAAEWAAAAAPTLILSLLALRLPSEALLVSLHEGDRPRRAGGRRFSAKQQQRSGFSVCCKHVSTAAQEGAMPAAEAAQTETQNDPSNQEQPEESTPQSLARLAPKKLQYYLLQQ